MTKTPNPYIILIYINMPLKKNPGSIKRDICFHGKFQSEFNPLTQKIQVTKTRNFQKWLREEALLMTSLVLILAVFMRRRSRRQFFPEDVVNFPRNDEDATNCCNAGTSSTRRTTPCHI